MFRGIFRFRGRSFNPINISCGDGGASVFKQNYQSRFLSRYYGPRAPVSQIKTQCNARKDPIDLKILANNLGEQNIKDLTTFRTNIELNDIELDLSDRKIILNLTWLRDSCHCNKCTHQYSRQRLFTPKDFKKPIFSVNEIRLEQSHEVSGSSACLYVEWADGHESRYSLDWLSYIDSLYKCSQLDLGRDDTSRAKFALPNDDFYSPTRENHVTPEYWDVSRIMSSLKPVDYHELVDGFIFHDEPSHINANMIRGMSSKRLNAMKTLAEQLLVYGLGKIINVPLERDHVLKVARSLAYERPTGYGTVFDVVVEPSEEINLAYSPQEFDLHSDLTYRETSPGVQMLHCITNSVDGGDSYFSDAFNAAQKLYNLNPHLFNVLVQYPATFVVRDPYRNLKFRKQKPILNLDHSGNLEDVYYSPFMLPPVGYLNDVKLFYLALDEFTKILQAQENKLVVKMDPGDLFIFHNRRVLHGRSSYDPTTSNRFLQGCYMDWDEIRCLHEKLIPADKIETTRAE